MRLGSLPLAVNASILFTELPLLQRFGAVKAAGFDAVELWWPFDRAVPARTETDALVSALDAADMRLVGLNLFAGDMAAGERGVLSWPERTAEVRDNAAVVADIAERTGCRLFNALYGQRRDDLPQEQQDDTAISNLVYVAGVVSTFGGALLVEPLTAGENGEYPLRTADDAVRVLDRVRDAGADNLRLLFDTYHLTNNGDDLVGVISRHGSRIGHVQIADSPGRGQPGTGSISFDRVLKALQDSGYAGYAACEYRPVGPSAESFGWIPAQTSPCRNA